LCTQKHTLGTHTVIGWNDFIWFNMMIDYFSDQHVPEGIPQGQEECGGVRGRHVLTCSTNTGMVVQLPGATVMVARQGNGEIHGT